MKRKAWLAVFLDLPMTLSHCAGLFNRWSRQMTH
ncbi:hypothetical protein [Escherichia coli]